MRRDGWDLLQGLSPELWIWYALCRSSVLGKKGVKSPGPPKGLNLHLMPSEHILASVYPLVPRLTPISSFCTKEVPDEPPYLLSQGILGSCEKMTWDQKKLRILVILVNIRGRTTVFWWVGGEPGIGPPPKDASDLRSVEISPISRWSLDACGLQKSRQGPNHFSQEGVLRSHCIGTIFVVQIMLPGLVMKGRLKTGKNESEAKERLQL